MQIGKYYNMKTQVSGDELYYICHDGRELHHIRTETKEQAGYTQMQSQILMIFPQKYILSL